MLDNIRTLIGPKQGPKLILLIASMFFGAMLETIGVSAIATACLSIIGGQGQPLPWAGMIPVKLTSGELLSALIALYLFKLAYLLLQNRIQSQFVCSVQHRASAALYDSTLHMPYSWFTKTSAAEIISLLNTDTGRAAVYLDAFLSLITEALTFLIISALMICVNPVMSLFVFAGSAISLFLTRGVIRPMAVSAGLARQKANVTRMKWLNQGVRGIKDIKVEQAEDYFSDCYEKADGETARCDAARRTLGKASGFCAEAVLTVCVLLYLLFLLLSGQNILHYFPSLSALVAAALRLLPNIKRISGSLVQMANMKASTESVVIALRNLRERDDAQTPQREIALSESVAASDVTFYYEGRPEPILSGVSIEIPIGSSTGIVGPSGNGKTTLADLLLGLLDPQEGTLTADGVDMKSCHASFLRHAAYIPQHIFLLDDTIRSNVIFCLNTKSADDKDIWAALEQASLASFVKKLPDGLDTLIGENGLRLSGGERQRLGIARALYKGAKLLVFDEATSALDPETEASVIQSIQSLQGEKTMIIISHRPSAVAGCDRIYRITDEHTCEMISAKSDNMG